MIYALRTEEEEGFRGLMSHRYEVALRYVKFSGPERYEPLLVIWAREMRLHFWQGLAAMR